MASRTEQKAAARAAREAKQQQLNAEAARRRRLYTLGGALGAAIAALIVIIIVSSSGGKGTAPKTSPAAVALVKRQLAGIPESGNVLGNPNAKVTITEYGDLVCPVCASFALTSEADLIAAEVKTGVAKLVYRGFETASGTANNSEYVNTQVAARAAGLQHRAWFYILLAYQVQPQTINGAPAETVSYINSAYLQGLAAKVPGLNLAQWQANLVNNKLKAAVNADGQAALAAGATGTPTIIVQGPKGTVKDPNAVPTLAQLQADIAQVS